MLMLFISVVIVLYFAGVYQVESFSSREENIHDVSNVQSTTNVFNGILKRDLPMVIFNFFRTIFIGWSG